MLIRGSLVLVIFGHGLLKTFGISENFKVTFVSFACGESKIQKCGTKETNKHLRQRFFIPLEAVQEMNKIPRLAGTHKIHLQKILDKT